MKSIRYLLLGCALFSSGTAGYPLDGYEDTGIRRLEYHKRIVTGEIQRRPVPIGARLPAGVILPRFPAPDLNPPFDTPDTTLSKAIAEALGEDAPKYTVAVLDLSDPDNPVYAEHNGHIRRNVGSVGKLLVALAWFQTLADVYPDDIAARERVLRDTWITADEFVISDHHKVIFYSPEDGTRAYRTIAVGDRGSLWEWLDWMLSASNNAAASTLQKQLLLLSAFGREYPPTPAQETRFFEENSRDQLGKQFLRLMSGAVERNGIDTKLLRQGSFFTRVGKRRVSGTSSYGNMRELVNLLYRVERATLVDAWSSTAFKRLMYMTQRRIRYASHPALNDYAVYFKSGSLYRCKKEAGFVCRKYQGNDLNLLASVATIEGPVNEPRYHYIVAVSSNVLRKNSAVAHQTLALRIHRLIEARHAARLQSDQGESGPGSLPFAGARLIGAAP